MVTCVNRQKVEELSKRKPTAKQEGKVLGSCSLQVSRSFLFLFVLFH
ncbi:hypothetical protein OIU77_018380, partial [Salix suchowensis]